MLSLYVLKFTKTNRFRHFTEIVLKKLQVTVNFRVGPFGFITINDPEYSGNMQFKDQALGLRWVKENIEQFGGDANNITLFGHSSGNDDNLSLAN